MTDIVSPRTTLKDVAREAGVHVSTASRALNPTTASVVNSETVERVTAVARRLDYRPHPLARGLRTNRTMSVGMAIPDVENPLFGPIIAGAESVLAAHSYSVLIGNADQGELDAEEVVSNLLEHHVDGLLLATATRSDDWIAEMVAGGVAVVLVNRSSDDGGVPAIVGDDHAGIGLAVRHLADLGHQHIGHIAGPSQLSTGLQRQQAFSSWMQLLDLDPHPEKVEEATWFQVEPGYKAALDLLSRRPDITAIVAANDLIALGCYRAVRSLGLEVPGDVSVTGYNDIPLLDLMQPAVTSVRVPYRQMGTQGATALIARMQGDSDEAPASIKLTPTLMIRSSTAPPRTLR